MGEECVDELKLGNVKMDSLRRTFEQVHAQASSVMLLTLKWSDLEEHYEKVERDLKERSQFVQEAEKVLEERRKEMVLKEDKLSSLDAQTRECSEQLNGKRKEVALEEGRLYSCSQELKRRKLELESVMQSVSDSSAQLATMKQELASIQRSMAEGSKEVHFKEQQLATAEKSLKEISARFDLEKKELSSVEKARAEQLKGLELKENENVSLRRSLEERLREVEMQELQLVSRVKALNLKQKEVDAVFQRVEEQKKELEVKKVCYDLEKRSLVDRLKELERKEAELDSRSKELDLKWNEINAGHQKIEEQKKTLEERFRQVDTKEEQLRVHSKELESKGKKMDACRRTVDDQRQILELREKQLTRTDHQSDVNDGRSLQVLLNELLTKHDLVHDQVSSAIKTSNYPAKLVLDAVQGSYSPLGNDSVYEPKIVRKSCILLLDQLLLLKSPQIGPHVQKAAIQLAHEWKDQMEVGAEDQLEVLRFLHLLAAFRISSTFAVDEYGALLDRIVDKKQEFKLRYHLRMTETTKVRSIPHKAKTVELDQLAVTNKGVNCSSLSAATSGDEHSGFLNKRPQADGSLNPS